jgi:hypothetical protein
VGIVGTLTQILVVVVLQVVGSIQKGRVLPDWSVMRRSLQEDSIFPAEMRVEVLKDNWTWKLVWVDPEELEISMR